jgi:GNAT superfamily N-acetyltransferase
MMGEEKEQSPIVEETYKIRKVVVYKIDGSNGSRLANLYAEHRHGVTFFFGLWVHPAHQGKGHAKRLARRALADYHTEYIYAYVWAFNDQPFGDSDLMALFERFGFFPIPEFPGVVIRHPSEFEDGLD